MITCYTGWSRGADTEWRFQCQSRGINVVICTKSSADKQTIEEGKEKIRKANQTLKRNVEKYLNFLALNWLQIKNSKLVIAIAPLIEPGKTGKKVWVNRCKYAMADGGTAYALQMAIDEQIPIYIFDTVTSKWKNFSKEKNNWQDSTFPPSIKENFAGIGASDLTENGKLAIEDVCNLSFPKKKWNLPIEPGPIYCHICTEDKKAKTDQDGLLWCSYCETYLGVVAIGDNGVHIQLNQ